jgi:Raf kinase inhibitor-like YbhB/YbcL family protein
MGIVDDIKHEIGKAFRGVRAGHEKVAIHRLKAPDGRSLVVTSAAFAEGEAIPRRYAGDGDDVSPPLAWSGLPAGTRSVAVLCEDPDAPFPKPFVHWLVHGLPPDVGALPEGVAKTADLPGLPTAHQGANSGRDEGYTGPMPPPGHGVHHYYFQVFALDAAPAVGASTTRDELVRAAEGHVLAAGALVGTYVRE